MDNNLVDNNKTVAIFCGANYPKDPIYVQTAQELAKCLVDHGYNIVTGGGSLGLMKAFNDATLQAGGVIIGVIPAFMVENGWHHTSLTQMHVVETMQDRKLRMANIAQAAVIAYPGGVGTYDELFEFIALAKLHVWPGKVLVYNLKGYFDPFVQMIQKAIDEGFMTEDAHSRYILIDTVEGVIEALKS